MTRFDALVERSRRGTVRLGLLSLMAGSTLLAGCARTPEPGPSKEEIWRQVYNSRLENLKALDRAFNELGQEYYKLEIEYKSAGREDLAKISRERANAFHEEHVEFQQRIAELERIDARLRRGEKALDIYESGQSQQPEAPTYTQPSPNPAQPPTGADSSQSYPPPSSSGYATPTRTPTPSRSGLGATGSSSSSRFNDPIIITDPQLNNR